MKKRIIAIMMIAVLMVSLAGCGGGNTPADIQQQTAEFLTEQIPEPTVSSMGGEWTVIGLARSGAEVPDGYFDTYFDNVRLTVKEKKGILNETHYTEYARVSIALAAIGENAADVEGYNLLAPLDEYENVIAQGVNGAAYALIAAHVNDYTLKNEENYITYILSQELKSGGFSYQPDDAQASADMTAIAIQALSLYPEYPETTETATAAIDVLASIQTEEGYFVEEGFDPSSESISQVITALVSMGIDPQTDERFIKGDKNLFNLLMDFHCENGFCHVADDGGNLLATEQAMCALASLTLLEEGSSLYAF